MTCLRSPSKSVSELKLEPEICETSDSSSALLVASAKGLCHSDHLSLRPLHHLLPLPRGPALQFP